MSSRSKPQRGRTAAAGATLGVATTVVVATTIVVATTAAMHAPRRRSHHPAPRIAAVLNPARKWFATLLILLLFAPAAFGAEPVTIAFKESAEVPGPNVSLGQVAELTGPEAAKLAGLDLGPVPWPGTKRLIDATMVKIKLYREGWDLTNVEFAGEGCIVSTQTITVTGSEMVEAAQAFLEARIPWPAEDVQIEVESQPDDQLVAAGTAAPVLEASLTGDIPAGGKVRVIVTGSSGGTALFRTAVGFHVRAFQNIVVARRNISQGEPFTDENVIERRLDVTAMSPGNLVPDKSALAGKKAARSIRTGIPIARQMVVIPPVIKRGSIVQIIYQTPFLSLSASGVAQEDGVPGKMIRLRNVDSGREVIGEVLPSGQVRVGP
ncbi:MAG TPA: flagellar basal body P-ring formation chaperone FlgA [Planctomycetota bacterium]|nr:flagellar basal body P-ring formation chaperone FlgA [Planctomycetota bacterium]